MSPLTVLVWPRAVVTFLSLFPHGHLGNNAYQHTARP